MADWRTVKKPVRISRYSLVVSCLMALQLCLVAWRAATESFVWDEVGHLASGISHLELGSFDLYRVNPPLIRTLAAIAPFLAGYEADWERYSDQPESRAEFPVGVDFIVANGRRSYRLLTLARWCTLWVPLLGAWICWRWSFELYGRASGLVALSLWVFSPLVLANAPLITADCGSAATGILAGYCFWRWLRNPSRDRTVLAGLAMGLALLTKTTWIILFGLLPLIALVWWAKPKKSIDRRFNACVSCGKLATIMGLGLLVLNLGYSFESTLTPLGSYTFVSHSFSGKEPLVNRQVANPGNRFSNSWMGSIPVLVPKNYLMGIDVQRFDFENCRRSYLRGMWREKGWWYYYIYGLWVKEPLATWLLAGLALISLFARRPHRGLSIDELTLLIPPLAILALISSQTGMNHHVRYAMPAIPFLFVWTSRIGCWLEGPRHSPQLLIGGLLLWMAISSLRVFPHSTTYFSEVVGGPVNGHLHLDNSNLDWGQGMLHLKHWYESHPDARPFYFANSLPLIDPSILGIRYETVPTRKNWNPESKIEPGWYAVSVVRLISFPVDYAFFTGLSPKERVANVYWIYHLSEKNAADLELSIRTQMTGDPAKE